MCDGNDGGENVVADGPASEFAGFTAALGHSAEALDSHDHGCYDHGEDCGRLVKRP